MRRVCDVTVVFETYGTGVDMVFDPFDGNEKAAWGWHPAAEMSPKFRFNCTITRGKKRFGLSY
jgi:hypothetical protein